MAAQGSGGAPRGRVPSAAKLRLLRELETRFGDLVADLDALKLRLAAARTQHALDTFRLEAERLTPE